MITDPALAALLGHGLREVEDAVAAFVDEAVVPRSEALAARGAALLLPVAADRSTALRHVRDALDRVEADQAGLEQHAARALERVVAALGALPWEVAVPLDPGLLARPASEPLRVRLRRLRTLVLARWTRLRGGAATRRVPVRQVLRIAFEARLADALVTATGSARRAEAEVLEIVRGVVQETRAADPGATRAAAIRFRELTCDALLGAVRAGSDEATRRLAVAGGPSLPSSELGLGSTVAALEEAALRLAQDAPAWADRLRAAEGTVRVAVLVETFADAVGTALRKRAKKPLAMARDALLSELSEIAVGLEATAAPVADAPADQGQGEVVRGCDALHTGRHVDALRRASERFRRATQPGQLVADLAELSRHLPDRLAVVDRRTPVERASRPGEVRITELPLAQRIGAIVGNELLPTVGAAVGAVAELVASTEVRVREAVSVTRYAADLAGRGGFESAEERRNVVLDGVARGARRIREHQEQLAAAFDQAALALEAAERDGAAKLRGLLSGEGDAALVVRTVRSSLRSAVDVGRRGWEVVRARTRDFEAAARQLSRQRAVRDLKIRSGHERLDATAIRAYLDAFLPVAEARGIPPVYVRLMSPAPVTEPRLFVARTALAGQLLDALSEAPVVAAPSTLLVGAAGAGKSSLLNLVTLQLVGPRVLWLDPAFASRDDGPLAALATELGVGAGADTVLDALAREPTVVLVDDLQRWIAPGTPGFEQLEALLGVIDRADGTRWLVSVDDAACRLLDEAVPLAHAFRRVVTVDPLDWRDLQAMFEVREQLGGFDTTYRPRTLLGRAADRLRPGHEKENYFRALASAAGGNPGTALAVHLDALQLEDGSALRVGTPTKPGLPFVEQLGEDTMALLAGLVRYGPLSPAALAAMLGRSEEALSAGIGFLDHAGLVAPARGGRELRLAPRVAASIRRELMELAVLPGRST